MKKVLKIFFDLFLIAIIWVTATSAREYYVAKNGIDSNDGSQNTPWLTIQKAANTAQAGDIVYIKNGTYKENVIMQNSGSDGNYITFKEYPGNKVILDGTGNAGWHGVFSIYGKDYIKLQDIEIRNNSIGWGVLIEHEQGNVNKASTHIELSGLEVHHTGGEAIQVRGNANNILIKNCVVHDADTPSGIDIYQWDGGRPHHITVSGCTTYNYTNFAGISSEQADNLIVENNISYSNELGIDIGSGSNNIISNNRIYNCNTGIALSSNQDSKVYNNIIHDIYNEAIYAYYWSAHSEPHARNKWYNNVIYNAGFGIFESNQKGSSGAIGSTSNHEYYNNLFYNIGSHGSYRTPLYFKGATGIKFYNNTIFMNENYDAIEFLDGAVNADIKNNIISISGNRSPIIMDSSSRFGSIIDYNCFHNRTGSINGPGDHSINDDPMFADPANNDFKLQSGSPCIDSGFSDVNIPVLDIEGNSKCDVVNTPNTGGGAYSFYDIGAYEYQCSTTAPYPPTNFRFK